MSSGGSATTRQCAGGSGAPAPKVYAENTRADAEAALRKLLIQESLDTG